MRWLALVFGLITAPAHAETVIASWYGPGFDGHRTASGEVYHQDAMTMAHRTLAFGTIVAVRYQGRCVEVRVTDRGPYIAGRSLDLSRGAARALGMIEEGVARVDMEVGGDCG